YKRQGTAEYLRSLKTDPPFEVYEYTEKRLLGDVRISSSRVRSALAEGNIQAVTGLLGRPYTIEGPVVLGDQRGRTIGFPTANVKGWDEQVLPANGVYATKVTLEDGREVIAATNIGVRPTVDGFSHRIEAHLLDFSEDLYGKTLSVAFIERIRAEKKFDGLDALKKQIDADVAETRRLLTPNQVYR
ncbi:MAG: riboflavin kinase, partial [Chloroflexota bacterium]